MNCKEGLLELQEQRWCVFSTRRSHWQHVGSARKSKKPGDLERLPPFFTFLPEVRIPVSCYKTNAHAIDFIFSFSDLSGLFLCLPFFFQIYFAAYLFWFTSSSPLLQVASGREEERPREGRHDWEMDSGFVGTRRLVSTGRL